MCVACPQFSCQNMGAVQMTALWVEENQFFSLSSFCSLLTFQQTEPFLLSFKYNSTMESVEIEVEVVKVWMLSLYGVKIRRAWGSSWLYKQLYSNLVQALNIE